MKDDTAITYKMSMIILAGGKSSRMGRDKSYLEYHGNTFLGTLIETGKKLGIQDIIVSGNHKIDDSVRCIPDRYVERGPLGGLEACLREAKESQCIVVCTDTPLVGVELLQRLIEYKKETDARIIACEHCGKQESLIGIYDTSLADEIEEELLHRKGSVFAFLNRMGCKWVEMDQFETCFLNINHPEEYQSLITGDTAI